MKFCAARYLKPEGSGHIRLNVVGRRAALLYCNRIFLKREVFQSRKQVEKNALKSGTYSYYPYKRATPPTRDWVKFVIRNRIRVRIFCIAQIYVAANKTPNALK